jgi:predicted type IV restriction endonuclease
VTHFCINIVINITDFDQARSKKEIERLVARFREHREEYHLPEYNEQKTRQDFVTPFFNALGWDMDNTKEASEV